MDAVPGGGPSLERGEPVIVESEFASVALRVDRDANGPRLRIEDRKGGRVRYLDPLELETLAWLPEQAMREWLDPSRHRWRDRPAGEP